MNKDTQQVENAEKEMNFDWFKIHKCMGESRTAQVAGVILMIVVIVGSIIYVIFG